MAFQRLPGFIPGAGKKLWAKPDQFLEALKVAIDALEGRYPGKFDLALCKPLSMKEMGFSGHQQLAGLLAM